MAIRFRQMNPGACRTYLVGQRGSGEVALVDPVLDRLDDYLTYLHRHGLRLTVALDTHTHADHLSAGSALRDITGCEVIMHERAPAACVSRRVKGGDIIKLGGFDVKVLHAPGHAADSILLVLPDRVLTGDLLFLDEGGGGRDDLPGGDAGVHWDSLQELARLPEKLLVFPAHEYRGRKPSPLGVQKRTNPHLKPRSREEFIAYIQELRLGPAEWMKDVMKANHSCARDPRAAWIPADLPACELKGTMERGANEQVVVPIRPEELLKKLDEGPAPVLLDVRERSELGGELGHIAGSVNIPVDEVGRRLSELDGYRTREVVTICRRGGRSVTAAQVLQQAGFGHVHFLEGGMTAWKEKGLPSRRD